MRLDTQGRIRGQIRDSRREKAVLGLEKVLDAYWQVKYGVA